MSRFIPIGLAMWIARLAFTLSFCAGLATAQTNSANYTFLLGSGFLCGQGDSSTCPAMAKSAQGDSYEMSGAGRFNAQDKTVRVAGTFTHKSANGNVIETGVWIATELVSFDSYGFVPGALWKYGIAQRPQVVGPQRMSKFSSPMPTDGLAVFHIRLFPIPGSARNALIQVTCALGEVPREHYVDGIRLSLENNGGEFSEEFGRHAMFFAVGFEGNTVRSARVPNQF